MHRLLTITFLLIGFMYYDKSHRYQILSIQKKISIDSTNNKEGDVIAYSTYLSGGNDYSLEIRTIYIYDKEYLTNGWTRVINKVVMAQKIIFKHKGVLISDRNSDARDRPAIKNHKKINLLDYIICEIATISGTKGSFYKITGYGGCKNSTDYTGYFSLTGTPVYTYYRSQLDGFYQETGNFKNVWKKYGVLESRENNAAIKATIVYPPKYSGQTNDAYIY